MLAGIGQFDTQFPGLCAITVSAEIMASAPFVINSAGISSAAGDISSLQGFRGLHFLSYGGGFVGVVGVGACVYRCAVIVFMIVWSE